MNDMTDEQIEGCSTVLAGLGCTVLAILGLVVGGSVFVFSIDVLFNMLNDFMTDAQATQVVTLFIVFGGCLLFGLFGLAVVNDTNKRAEQRLQTFKPKQKTKSKRKAKQAPSPVEPVEPQVKTWRLEDNQEYTLSDDGELISVTNKRNKR